MRTVAIRGATSVEANNAEMIKQASVELVKKIVSENNIQEVDIVMVFLTMTKDLTSYNASSAIRLGMAWNDVPFFTSQEPHIEGGLERCIRILIQIISDKAKSEIKHVYLGEAQKLRPDLKSS